MDGVTIKLDGFDLDDAKAMAHLKTEGAETKASIGFGQTDALYLVYDGNEIRLPDIQFSVEVPDNMSNWEKKQLLKDIHISVGTPEIKDCGNYIFVKASLSYYTTFNGYLETGPIHSIGIGGGISMGAIAYYLVRKADGQIFDITDDVSKELAPLKDYNNMVVDSDGNAYLVFHSGVHMRVYRLFEAEGRFEMKSVNVGLIDRELNDDSHYIQPLAQNGPVVIGEDGKVYTVSSGRHINAEEGCYEGNMVLGILSSDLTCEKVNIAGMLIGFHKSGNDLMLFVADRSTFKLYNATDGCKLLSSVTKEGYDERFMFEEFREVDYEDGVYSYYGADLIVRFDVNSGECTVSEVNETICSYLSYHNNAHAKAYCGGKFYVAYSPDEENYVEVLKVDVMAETVEKLRRLDGPEGCFFSGGIMIEDESEGKLLITGTFIRKDDGMGGEVINQQIIVPEIAQAYAEANAVEDHGIDFGTYKVVNVVPLTDDLDSSEN